jgi:hypothetical protein
VLQESCRAQAKTEIRLFSAALHSTSFLPSFYAVLRHSERLNMLHIINLPHYKKSEGYNKSQEIFLKLMNEE